MGYSITLCYFHTAAFIAFITSHQRCTTFRQMSHGVEVDKLTLLAEKCLPNMVDLKLQVEPTLNITWHKRCFRLP